MIAARKAFLALLAATLMAMGQQVSQIGALAAEEGEKFEIVMERLCSTSEISRVPEMEELVDLYYKLADSIQDFELKTTVLESLGLFARESLNAIKEKRSATRLIDSNTIKLCTMYSLMHKYQVLQNFKQKQDGQVKPASVESQAQAPVPEPVNTARPAPAQRYVRKQTNLVPT